MFALSEAIQNVAATLAIFAGIATALTVLGRFTRAGKIMGWFWHRLITIPLLGANHGSGEAEGTLTRWARSIVNGVVDERLMAPNGGKSLADISDKLDRHDRAFERIDQRLLALEHPDHHQEHHLS